MDADTDFVANALDNSLYNLWDLSLRGGRSLIEMAAFDQVSLLKSRLHFVDLSQRGLHKRSASCEDAVLVKEFSCSFFFFQVSFIFSLSH